MFSVVMPVWNARRTLARAVASVVAQRFEDFELVVVDDGSTDDGLATLPRPIDPRVVILRPEHGGEAAARNLGVRSARHDWIAFLDADDVWFPGHLAELDRVRRRFPEAGLIGTAYVHSDRRGRFSAPAERDEPVIEIVPYFERVGANDPPLHVSTCAIPRSVLEALGGFRPHYGLESEVFARIALTRPVATSSRRTAVRVHGTGGVSSNLRRWQGQRLRTAGDISPAAAVVEAWCARHGAGSLPGAEAFLDRYVGWCLQSSAAIADVEQIRSLRRLYRRRAPVEDRMLLAAGRLPAPLARLVMPRPLTTLARATARALGR